MVWLAMHQWHVRYCPQLHIISGSLGDYWADKECGNQRENYNTQYTKYNATACFFLFEPAGQGGVIILALKV